MSDFLVRAAVAADGMFLADMLVEAANWQGTPLRPRAQVLAGDHRRYLAGWRRPADTGVIAVDATAAPIGAAWYRLLPHSEPGFGFVAAGVPELVIGVRAPWRSRGVGRALLSALVDCARQEGYARLSLSVEHGNHAETLYRDEGFRAVASSLLRTTMVRRLR